jgi:hypothetical protein
VVKQQTCRIFTEVLKPGLGNRFPTAQYIHSKAHVLSLAIVHSSLDVHVSARTMLGTVQEITFAFHYSSKILINLSKNHVGTIP